jgi:hypothetical protein
VEELFADVIIAEGIWKMNASQLEDLATRQDKYLKNLKRAYQKVLININ